MRPLLPGTYTVQVSPGAPRTGAKALERTTLTGVTVKEGRRIKRSVKLKVRTKPTPVELERRRQGGPKGGLPGGAPGAGG